jgi:hypothetical protein
VSTPPNGENRRELDVISTLTPPICPRCEQEGILSARVPHGWDRADGTQTTGTTIVVLCPICDADDAYAGPLVTFFIVHGAIEAATLEQAADLLQTWADHITIPALNLDTLEAETQAWRRGEYD